MSAGAIVAVRAIVSGRVQGVWFRGWMVEEATARGLSGWVRNRTDGTVEALFAGPKTMVDDMITACRKGPPAARVVDVRTEPAEPPADREFRPVPTL